MTLIVEKRMSLINDIKGIKDASIKHEEEDSDLNKNRLEREFRKKVKEAVKNEKSKYTYPLIVQMGIDLEDEKNFRIILSEYGCEEYDVIAPPVDFKEPAKYTIKIYWDDKKENNKKSKGINGILNFLFLKF